MKVFDPDSFQDELFDASHYDDYCWKSVAAARCHYGAAAEELASKVLGFERIKPSGKHDICFDGKDSSKNFYEVKSLRKGNKAPLYKFRLEKDKLAGVELFYVFVIHKINHAKTVGQIWEGLSKGVEIVVLDHWAVCQLCAGLKTHRIKGKSTKSGTRNGYQREGYKDGYANLPCRTIQSQLCVPHKMKIISHNREIPVQLMICV